MSAFLVDATWWSKGGEGTLGESENIKWQKLFGMPKIVYEREDCNAPLVPLLFAQSQGRLIDNCLYLRGRFTFIWH